MDTSAWAIAFAVVAILVLATMMKNSREGFSAHHHNPAYIEYAGQLVGPMTDTGSVQPYDGDTLHGDASNRTFEDLSDEALGNSRGFRSLAPRDPSSGAASWSVISRAPDGKRVAGSRRRTGWVGAMLEPAPPCAS